MRPEELKLARALLGWTQAHLAHMSEIGLENVKKFEDGGKVRPDIRKAIEAAVKEAGVTFPEAGTVKIRLL